MLLNIPNVLTPEEVAEANKTLGEAQWIDGRITAGHQSAKAKANMQVPEDHPAARKIGEMILAGLGKNNLFISSALPLRVFPPLFNRYRGGESFGTHVDNAIRQVTGTPNKIRTDLSATLFLTDPESYEGGDLVVEDTYGVHKIKLPAGHLVLYPASSLHHVQPVMKGERVCSFFWIQSMVRDDGQRSLLFDLDLGIQRINQDHPDHPSAMQLTGVYHNLLRRWSDL